MGRSFRRFALATVMLALVGLLPALALGSTGRTVAPTTAERAAIIKAFGDPPAAGSCLIVRLAASNRNYATVRFHAARRCTKYAFNGVNVLKRRTDDHWKVVFEGSSYRCPIARIPRQVQRDLGICA
jgi:hypothetical protein